MKDIRGEGEEWWDGWVECWEAEVEPENGVGIWACFSSALGTRRITWLDMAAMSDMNEVSAHHL